jgi:hypothetical protein
LGSPASRQPRTRNPRRHHLRSSGLHHARVIHERRGKADGASLWTAAACCRFAPRSLLRAGGIETKIRNLPGLPTRSQKCMLRRMREARGGCALRKAAAGCRSPKPRGTHAPRGCRHPEKLNSLSITPFLPALDLISYSCSCFAPDARRFQSKSKSKSKSKR